MLAVAMGAFGAHALKARLSPEALGLWKTAVEYHFYHTLALLLLAAFFKLKGRLINAASYGFTFGIIFFSGSLYLLALREVFNADYGSILGPVTPFGGLLFIAGWFCLLLAALKNKNA